MTTEYHILGQAAALGAAITWASALVLFKRSGERVPPVALNMYKNVVGLILLFATLGVMALVGTGDINTLYKLHPGDVCLLLLSGVIGIAVADSLLFAGLNLIGVGLMAVVDCTYAPLCILFAWLLLAETLTAYHYIGAALTVAGVFIASRHKPPVGRTRGQLLLGILLSVLAIAMMAVGIVLPKPILEEAGLIPATTLRMVAGTILLALFALLGRNWKQHWTIFKPTAVWKFALPAAILGTYLSMTLWVAGFKYTHATVAAVLNQTSVIFASIFAAVFLKEHFGGRKVVALVLAVIGVILITLGDQITLAWLWLTQPPTL